MERQAKNGLLGRGTGLARLLRASRLLARLVLAGVFLAAGSLKLADPRAFAGVIEKFGLAPEVLLAPLAIGLPLLELLAGLGLLAGIRGSLALISAQLVFFCAVLAWGIGQEVQGDCGCFSAGDLARQDALETALVRDIFLLLACAWLYWGPQPLAAPAPTQTPIQKQR